MKKIIYKHETSTDFYMSSVIGLSDFLNFEKNPAFMHFYQNRENNQMTNFGADFCLTKEESMSFRFSEPILELLTDPETFFSTYVTVPKIDTRSEKGKMELKNFMDQTKNFIHLSPYQMDLVSKAASVIKMDENLINLIETCQFGITALYTDTEMGSVKVRPSAFLTTAKTVLQLIVTDKPISPPKYKNRMTEISNFNKHFLDRETVFLIVNVEQPVESSIVSTSEDAYATFTGNISSVMKMIFWCQSHEIFPGVNKFNLMKKLIDENRLEDFEEEVNFVPQVSLV